MTGANDMKQGTKEWHKGDITPSKHHLKIVPDTKTLQDILISVSHCFIIYIGSIDVCYIGIQPSDVLHMQCIVVLCQPGVGIQVSIGNHLVVVPGNPCIGVVGTTVFHVVE